MRAVTYYVIRIGDGWSVSCSHDDVETTGHPDRGSAITAARSAAAEMWHGRQAASRVMVDEDDGQWHEVIAFGTLL